MSSFITFILAFDQEEIRYKKTREKYLSDRNKLLEAHDTTFKSIMSNNETHENKVAAILIAREVLIKSSQDLFDALDPLVQLRINQEIAAAKKVPEVSNLLKANEDIINAQKTLIDGHEKRISLQKNIIEILDKREISLIRVAATTTTISIAALIYCFMR